ncbi:unnamed protein product [Notodromas monacha]|uniref:ER membrane protein complex subunit 7 beta-sandwich domain-containing protein n=1 Tax=Notodromas monacha TaxID=399045 RepID=A0A7R9BZ13_9CRUS|nr:unnamed protein product [Notodromas monacha]CAG0924289.1 unnamed protein product [Notodromas monacha]
MNLFVGILVFVFTLVSGNETNSNFASEETFQIDGKILPPSDSFLPFNMESVEIVVNGRKRVSFVRSDGTFSVTAMPAGSHLIEIASPNYFFEPVKVDISSKGKFRARKVNLIQPSQLVQVPYPLKLKPLGASRYFQAREQWRIQDLIYSPMVLMMVLPLIFIVVLPKLMSDPDARKEMEQIQMPKYEMPDLSEMMTSFFAGDTKKAKQPAVKPAPVPYPLKLKPLGASRYFQAREQWRIQDLIYSPMVLMMVLPLIFIVVLPKLMSDPDARKEMEQIQMPKYEMPDLSEMMTSFFAGDTKKAKQPAVKPAPEMEQIQMPKYEMPDLSEMMTSFFAGDTKKAKQPAVKPAPVRRRQ